MAINVKKGGAYSAVNSIFVKKGGTYRAIADMFVKTAGAYQSVSFSPMALFTTGVSGAWYDPSDFSTMFQDAAGTVPVTAVGQPVGLMLDKSNGLVLGPELVTNGGFSSSSGWVLSTLGGSATISGGLLTLFGGSSAYPNATQSAVLTSGRWYKVVVVLTSTVTSGSLSLRLGGITSQYKAFTNAGIYTLNVLSDGADLMLIRNSGFTDTITIDNISVRELPGNHAFNPSGNSANFPVLSARYNLLTYSEQFDNAAWGATGGTVTANTVTSPNGTVDADSFIESAGSTDPRFPVGYSFTSGVKYTLSVYAKAIPGSAQRYLMLVFNSGYATPSGCNFDLVAGTVGESSSATGAIQSVGNGWYRCTMTPSTNATGIGALRIRVAAVNTSGNITAPAAYTGDGTSGIYLWGADLRVTNDALNQPAYQRVNTATDYDTVGFKPYLSFNGVNQWLQTNSIDFSYGDKMFVSAGVRKLSDALDGFVAELSSDANTNGRAFWLTAPAFAGANFGFFSKGVLGSYSGQAVGSGYTAPTTRVLGGIGDISGDQSILRVNGTQAAISTADQGTGNYGNYPLYIGARGGASLWFNGRLYGLVVAGKAASASEIASTESWLNQKTGAY